MTRALLLLLAILAASIAPAARAADSSDGCDYFIDTIPTVANIPGTWCVTGDLDSADEDTAAIQVTADNVVLDCNGFTLDGSAAGNDTTADGVLINSHNVTVRQCGIRGFRYGIIGGGPYAGGPFHIEDNRVEQSRITGIRALGLNAVVRGNRVFQTGGSPAAVSASGISAGYGADVFDNTVVGVTPTAGSNGSGTGIYVTGFEDGNRVADNRVRDVTRDGTGLAYGIRADGGTRASLTGNDVVGTVGTGLACTSVSGRARNNVISGFPTALSGCISAGGNVVKP